MVRFTVDNRNRLIFYGNPVGYVKDDAAVVDEMFRTDELNQYLSRMNLTPRWEDGIFDRLVSGEVTGEEPVQPRKGCRIWQLKKDVDVAMRFIGYEDQVRKFGEPDAENYTLVFDGDLGTSDLEQIYTICRDAPPPGYQGYRMALSDVVELYNDSGSEFYYANREDLEHNLPKSNKAEDVDVSGAYAVSGRGGMAHEPAVDKPRRRGGKQMKTYGEEDL